MVVGGDHHDLRAGALHGADLGQGQRLAGAQLGHARSVLRARSLVNDASERQPRRTLSISRVAPTRIAADQRRAVEVGHRHVVDGEPGLGSRTARAAADRIAPDACAARPASSARGRASAAARSMRQETRVARRQRQAVGSRTVGTATISTGRLRSATTRRTTATCCASFWPKNATSGCTIDEQLGAHRRHAPEVARPGRSLEHRGRARRARPRCRSRAGRARPRPARTAGRRRPPRPCARVGRLVARVARQVGRLVELRRVDEQADHDEVAAGSRGRP